MFFFSFSVLCRSLLRTSLAKTSKSPRSKFLAGFHILPSHLAFSTHNFNLLTHRYGYLHSCPTNLGTGMRASVHVDLPGWTKEGLPALKVHF